MDTRTRTTGARRRPRPAPAERPARPFTVVGVGASAGGLEALRQLLGEVEADAGLSFVVIQHLEAGRVSLLGESLAQATRMKVAQVVQGVRLEPGCVYVIPPGVHLALERDTLRLLPMDADALRPHLPIDFFFRSLAAGRGERAIGVILSGTASDGTAGLADIRAHGGITFAQDPGSARFAAMPQSAIDAGVVDSVLTIPVLAAELTRLAGHPYLLQARPRPSARPRSVAALAKVLDVMRRRTGVDFGEYKPATLDRRLARRMAVRQADGVDGYLAMLAHEPDEVRALHEDFLIKVTEFFRDDGVFEELARVALPEIVKHKAAGGTIRAWVVGCATGEEVYSLAMTLLENLDDAPGEAHPIQIFGSDLSDEALAVARAGVYPDAAVRKLGEERLKRWFVRTDRGWRVNRELRDRCIFAHHDVAKDPPFAHLDLLCCRNVLIYFGQVLQRRVLAEAHACLNRPGFLLLGSSETAAGVPAWFVRAGKLGGLFRRRPGESTFRLAPRSGAGLAGPGALDPRALTPRRPAGSLGHQVDALVLERYGPPGVVVDERLEVLQFRGRTGPFLEPPAGEPQQQLLKLARRGLAAPLRLAIARARETSVTVRLERVTLQEGGAPRTCDLVVIPVPPEDGEERSFVVLFEERPPAPRVRAVKGGGKGRTGAAGRGLLEEALASSRAEVEALVVEHARANDALSSGNDALVSANEELQSLNEELETAKEELQASNEELSTVNDELQARNLELQRVNADVLDLLDAAELPIVMLDGERRIRRFTRRAGDFMRLTAADVGRRLAELALPFEAPDLDRWIARATADGILVEGEVLDRTGRWHRLQVRPRRVPGGGADGAILSLVDIDDLRNEVKSARWARDQARSIVEAVQVPLVVLDAERRVLSANAAYHRTYGGGRAEIEGRSFFELDGGAWDLPALRQALAGAGLPDARFDGLELERAGVRSAVSASGCAIPSHAGAPMTLLVLEDVTERREVERHRAELLTLAEGARGRAEQADAAKDSFLATLSHELRSPLAVIQLRASALRSGKLEPEAIRSAGASIEASVRREARLVEELLDVSRIASGKVVLSLEPVDWHALVAGVAEGLRPEAEAKQLTLEVGGEAGPLRCLGDPGRLQQVVANLVANAIKFTPAGGRVRLRTDAIDGVVRLVVSDSGHGIDAAFLPHVFERFAQQPGARRDGAGLGLGLAIAHHLVGLHGGTLRAESPGAGLGSTFTVTVPRA